MDLRIKLIKPKNEIGHPKVGHPILPQHEFSMLIVAPKGSGKTNFICNLILNHYRKYFHQIYVCSPTIDNDEKWDVVKDTPHVLLQNRKLENILNGHGPKEKKLRKVVFEDEKQMQKEDQKNKVKFDGKIPEENFFSDMSMIPSIIQKQQDIIERIRNEGYGDKSKFLADRNLIILDDQAGMFKAGNTQNPMVNFVIKHRHSSSSLIIVTQAYKAIPRTIRSNCNALVLFEIPNLVERKSIYEENPEGLKEDQWMDVYEYATEKPFSFLYSNNKFTKGKRLYRCFESRIEVSDSASDEDSDHTKDDLSHPPNPNAKQPTKNRLRKG